MTGKSKLIKNLKALRELLTPKDQWTQGCNARDSQGVSIDLYNSRARSYCIHGGLWSVVGLVDYAARDNMKRALGKTTREIGGDGSIVVFNDNSTHKKILSLIDRTIEREQR